MANTRMINKQPGTTRNCDERTASVDVIAYRPLRNWSTVMLSTGATALIFLLTIKIGTAGEWEPWTTIWRSNQGNVDISLRWGSFVYGRSSHAVYAKFRNTTDAVVKIEVELDGFDEDEKPKKWKISATVNPGEPRPDGGQYTIIKRITRLTVKSVRVNGIPAQGKTDDCHRVVAPGVDVIDFNCYKTKKSP